MKKNSLRTSLLRPVMFLTLMVGFLVSSPKTFAADPNSLEGNDSQLMELTLSENLDSYSFGNPNDLPPIYYDRGWEGVYQRLCKDLKYPHKAAIKRVQGDVLVVGTLDRNGKIKDFRIEQSSGDKDLDKEALRVCKKNFSKGWTPAMKDGEVISCRLFFPVKFRLQ